MLTFSALSGKKKRVYPRKTYAGAPRVSYALGRPGRDAEKAADAIDSDSLAGA
jgi:hypothetical protein